MKKISVLVAVAAVAVSSLMSCNGVSDSGKVANSLDTLSITMGRMYGYGLSEQFAREDTAFDKDAFIRGFEMAVNIDTTEDSYRRGVMVGAQIVDMMKGLKEQNKVELNSYLFITEFKKAFTSDSSVNVMSMQGMVNMLMQKEMRAAKERDPKAVENKAAGKKFIDELVKKDTTMKVTESGLAYKVLKPGNGKQFKTTDRVMVKYKGTKIDGSVFDESKEAVAMSPVSVVPGFKEALLMMSPGAQYIIYVPGELAYGVDGRMPRIEPNETLIFELETIGVEPAKKK